MLMPASSNTVEINGYLVRELRKREGLSVVELAQRVQCTRPHIANIELGHRRRVSLKMFGALISTFSIEDRRSLLANPYGDTDDLEQVS